MFACFADWSNLQKSLPLRALGSHTDGKVSQVKPLMLAKVTLLNGMCMFSIFVSFFGFLPAVLIAEGVNHTDRADTVISIQVSFKFIFNR